MKNFRIFGLPAALALLAFGLAVACSNGTTESGNSPVPISYRGTSGGKAVVITFSDSVDTAKARAILPANNSDYRITVDTALASEGKAEVDDAGNVKFHDKNGTQFSGKISGASITVSGIPNPSGGAPLSVGATTTTGGTGVGGVGGDDSTAPATGVEFDKTSIALTTSAGKDTATLTATVLPGNAADKQVVFSVSGNSPTVVNVEVSGSTATITAAAEGTVTISAASASNPNATPATCTVTVVDVDNGTPASTDTWAVLELYAETETITAQQVSDLTDAVIAKLEGIDLAGFKGWIDSGEDAIVVGGDATLDVDDSDNNGIDDTVDLYVVLGADSKDIKFNLEPGWDFKGTAPVQPVTLAAQYAPYEYPLEFAIAADSSAIEFTLALTTVAKINYEGIAAAVTAIGGISSGDVIVIADDGVAFAAAGKIAYDAADDSVLVRTSASGDSEVVTIAVLTDIETAGYALSIKDGEGAEFDAEGAGTPGSSDYTGYTVYEYKFASNEYTLTLEEPTPPVEVTAITVSLPAATFDGPVPYATASAAKAGAADLTIGDVVTAAAAQQPTTWTHAGGTLTADGGTTDFPGTADLAYTSVEVLITPKAGYKFPAGGTGLTVTMQYDNAAVTGVTSPVSAVATIELNGDLKVTYSGIIGPTS